MSPLSDSENVARCRWCAIEAISRRRGSARVKYCATTAPKDFGNVKNRNALQANRGLLRKSRFHQLKLGRLNVLKEHKSKAVAIGR